MGIWRIDSVDPESFKDKIEIDEKSGKLTINGDIEENVTVVVVYTDECGTKTKTITLYPPTPEDKCDDCGKDDEEEDKPPIEDECDCTKAELSATSEPYVSEIISKSGGSITFSYTKECGTIIYSSSPNIPMIHKVINEKEGTITATVPESTLYDVRTLTFYFDLKEDYNCKTIQFKYTQEGQKKPDIPKGDDEEDTCEGKDCNSLELNPNDHHNSAAEENAVLAEYTLECGEITRVTSVSSFGDEVNITNISWSNTEIFGNFPSVEDCGKFEKDITYTITIEYKVNGIECSKNYTFTITQETNKKECSTECTFSEFKVESESVTIGCEDDKDHLVAKITHPCGCVSATTKSEWLHISTKKNENDTEIYVKADSNEGSTDRSTYITIYYNLECEKCDECNSWDITSWIYYITQKACDAEEDPNNKPCDCDELKNLLDEIPEIITWESDVFTPKGLKIVKCPPCANIGLSYNVGGWFTAKLVSLYNDDGEKVGAEITITPSEDTDMYPYEIREGVITVTINNGVKKCATKKIDVKQKDTECKCDPIKITVNGKSTDDPYNVHWEDKCDLTPRVIEIRYPKCCVIDIDYTELGGFKYKEEILIDENTLEKVGTKITVDPQCDCECVTWDKKTSFVWACDETEPKKYEIKHLCGEIEIVKKPDWITSAATKNFYGTIIEIAPNGVNDSTTEKSGEIEFSFKTDDKDCINTVSVSVTQDGKEAFDCDEHPMKITANPSTLPCTGGEVLFSIEYE